MWSRSEDGLHKTSTSWDQQQKDSPEHPSAAICPEVSLQSVMSRPQKEWVSASYHPRQGVIDFGQTHHTVYWNYLSEYTSTAQAYFLVVLCRFTIIDAVGFHSPWTEPTLWVQFRFVMWNCFLEEKSFRCMRNNRTRQKSSVRIGTQPERHSSGQKTCLSSPFARTGQCTVMHAPDCTD